MSVKRNRPLGNYHKHRSPEEIKKYNEIISLYIQGKIPAQEVGKRLALDYDSDRVLRVDGTVQF
jgi:hypothetical protein